MLSQGICAQGRPNRLTTNTGKRCNCVLDIKMRRQNHSTNFSKSFNLRINDLLFNSSRVRDRDAARGGSFVRLGRQHSRNLPFACVDNRGARDGNPFIGYLLKRSRHGQHAFTRIAIPYASIDVRRSLGNQNDDPTVCSFLNLNG